SGGPHGPAHSSHAGGATSSLAGRTGGSAAPRASPADTARGCDGPRGHLRSAAHRSRRTPGGKLALLFARLLGVARSRALRSRSQLGCLAPRRACVLLRDGPLLLAARDPGLARTVCVATVGDDSLPRARRSPEHSAGGDPHVFGPRDLPGLRRGASGLGPHGAGGSGHRRRAHVGSGLVRVPPAHDLADRAVALTGPPGAVGKPRAADPRPPPHIHIMMRRGGGWTVSPCHVMLRPDVSLLRVSIRWISILVRI